MTNPCIQRRESTTVNASFANAHFPSFHIQGRLVRASSLLASLELVQVPSADGQVALVLVHALAEVVYICSTGSGVLRVLSARGVVCVLLQAGLLLLDGC